MNAVVTTQRDWEAVGRWVDRAADRAGYAFRSHAHQKTMDWADGFLAGCVAARVIDSDAAKALRDELVANGDERRRIESERTSARIAELTARPIGSRFD